jgi:hypothetical protein
MGGGVRSKSQKAWQALYPKAMNWTDVTLEGSLDSYDAAVSIFGTANQIRR